ncbi:hypothetical protein DRJ72_14140, partial [Enterococcus faecalis]
ETAGIFHRPDPSFCLAFWLGRQMQPVVSSFNGEGKLNSHVSRGMHRVITNKYLYFTSPYLKGKNRSK